MSFVYDFFYITNLDTIRKLLHKNDDPDEREYPEYRVETESELTGFFRELAYSESEYIQRDFLVKEYVILKNGRPLLLGDGQEKLVLRGDIRRTIGKLLQAFAKKPQEYRIKYLQINGLRYADIRDIREESVTNGGERLTFDAFCGERSLRLGLPVVTGGDAMEPGLLHHSIPVLSLTGLYVLSDKDRDRLLTFFDSRELLWYSGDNNKTRVDLFCGVFRNEHDEVVKGIFYYFRERLLAKYAVKENKNGTLCFMFSDLEWTFNRDHPISYELTTGDPIPQLIPFSETVFTEGGFAPSPSFTGECRKLLSCNDQGKAEWMSFYRKFEEMVIFSVLYPKNGKVKYKDLSGNIYMGYAFCLQVEMVSKAHRAVCSWKLPEKFEFRLADYHPNVNVITLSLQIEIKGNRGGRYLLKVGNDMSQCSVSILSEGEERPYEYFKNKGLHDFSMLVGARLKCDHIFGGEVIQYMLCYLGTHFNELACIADELDEICQKWS